ncbi:MAG: type II toxin-antitoxin system VapC family toxin [marine benthic group bacterium]|nr:type II toxin-antitoxin system VapC family toxin [Gemmatimonadota bacterium]
MIVPDASVLVDLLRCSDGWEALAARLFRDGETLHVPHVVDLEIAQALRGSVRRRETGPARAAEALTDLGDLPLYRYPHSHLMVRIWEIRDSLTAYDASYVALAEALDATLLTRDSRLARAGGHQARVELV